VSARGLRRALAGPALALASVAFTAGVVEGVLRLAGYTPERFRNTARVADPRGRMLLDCYPTNPRRYFDLDLRVAEVRERYRWLAPVRLDAVARRAPWAVEFQYNSRRFRDAELVPKRPGVHRVLVVGDSFTEGQGVRETDTYPRTLERLLNDGAHGEWEVRNCARRAADFPALYEQFQEVLPFEPDVLVYAMVLNDPVRSPEFHARQAYVNDWILDRGRILAQDETGELGPWDLRLFALVTDDWRAWRIGRETTRWYREMYEEPNRSGWVVTQELIRRMQRGTRNARGRFVLMSWPLLVQLDRYPFAAVNETIGRFCAEARIERVDLLPVLQGRPTETLWVHPVDHHPNEVAHRLAAETLRAVLLRQPH
jgi:hypothetical protein